MSVILLLYLFVYIFSFIYILHIIIDILISFNLRNHSCFRFWVFCLLFRLQNPPRGFFSLSPARYTHILLHFYDLVSGSGFSACFSVSKTHVVGFSACFPLTTPTFCSTSTIYFPALDFLLAFPSPKPTLWVFQPVSCLPHPHPVNLPRRNGRNPLPAAQIILFDYKFFPGHIFFLVNMECVQYRVL